MLILDGFQLDSHDWTLDANPIPGIAGTFRDDDQAIVPQDLPTDDVRSCSKLTSMHVRPKRLLVCYSLSFTHVSLLPDEMRT